MHSPGTVGKVDRPPCPARVRRRWDVAGRWDVADTVGWRSTGHRAADQLPAALMDGPVMGPAEQGQVGQVGGAAMEPVAQVVGVAPGQGSGAVGEDTAAVADGQGGALAGLDDPGGPSDLQRLGGGATQGRGQQGRRGPEPGRQPVPCPARGPGQAALWLGVPLPGPGSVPVARWGRGRGGAGGQRCWRVTSTRVTAPSQASRRHASGSSGPAQPTSPPTAPGRPRRLSRSTITLSCGRTPPAWGSRPPSRARRASSVRASALRWLPLRVSVASAGRASGSNAASRVWPASGSNSPSTATMPSKVGANHNPRRAWRRSRSRSAPSGSATWSRCPRSRRSRVGSSCRAASTSTGSASAVTWSGKVWVPWVTTWAWATDSSPSHTAWAVPVKGPRNRARAVRTALVAARSLRWRRLRSHPAVDPNSCPWSAPAAPRASTPARSLSHWPSRRSTSRRSSSTCSAWTVSASPSRSARSSTAAVRAASLPGRPTESSVECVFESMGGTYQPHNPKQPPKPNLWTTSPRGLCANAESPQRALVRARFVPGTCMGLTPRPTVPGDCMGPERSRRPFRNRSVRPLRLGAAAQRSQPPVS